MEVTTLLPIKNTNDYKYYVIQFLELPNKDIDEIVCIPWMWIVSHSKKDLDVIVSYPVENPSDTEKRVKEREKYSKQWKLCKSIVIYATDSYQDAKHYTTKRMNEIHYNQCSNMRDGGHQSSAKVGATTHKCKRSASSNPSKSKPLEFVLSSKNDDRPALKRSKVVELAEALNSPDKNQSSPMDENPSNSSVEPRIIASREFFTEFFTLLRDLHTTPARDASMIDLLRETLIQNAETMRKAGKLIDDTRASLSSTTITPEASTSTGTSSKSKLVLPPEYDENDSRWTLRHRKLAPGLVELMPHTSVYIDADKLSHCKTLAKDCRSLARMLLPEIFIESALSVCSFTGERARAYDVEGTAVRPGLDENARNVLVSFVQEYGKENHWITAVETLSIQNSIRNKLQDMRLK